MSRFKKLLIVFLVAIGITSCNVLNQVAQIANFANCKFNFESVDQVKMLDVQLSKGMTKSDLNIAQLASLTSAILKKQLPVSFNVNLDVNNPNAIPAAMTKMDYILTLNGKEVISTTLNKSINVGANSSSIVSIPVQTDLFQLFSGESADAIVNLAFKLTGVSSNPVNVGLKVKPYISVGNQQLAYPEYITLNKTLQ